MRRRAVHGHGETLRPRLVWALALAVTVLSTTAAAVAWSAPARAFSGAGPPTAPRTTSATRSPTPPRSPSATGTSTSRPPAVPPGFVGIDADGPALGLDNSLDFDNQVGSMVANGAQSIRVAFNWAAAEPYQSWSDVPAADRAKYIDSGGRPYSFTQTDVVVGDAAQHGATVLPTVLYTPAWDARENPQGPVNTPRHTAPYGAYLTALIGRYGPHGTFWHDNPQIRKVPVRSWQIWNEENLGYYWPQPYARSYLGLLRAAHAAIRRADPGATVVLGALTNVAWKAIGQLYAVGARSQFDVVSVNGFTKLPANVILYLHYMRTAMNRFKDNAKPLLATEVSWPSAIGHTREQFDFDTTQAGQARNIATLLALIGQSYESLRLAGFYYYTWMGNESDTSHAFNFAGLLSFRKGKVTAKPALAAFRRGALALEHCHRTASLASSCIS